MTRTAPAGPESRGLSHLSVLTINLKVQQHGGWHTSLTLERSSVFSGLSRPILYKSSQIPPVHCKHRPSGGWEGREVPHLFTSLLETWSCQLEGTFGKIQFLPIEEKILFKICLYENDWLTVWYFLGRWTIQVSGWLPSPADFLPAPGSVSNCSTQGAGHLLQ